MDISVHIELKLLLLIEILVISFFQQIIPNQIVAYVVAHLLILLAFLSMKLISSGLAVHA